MKIPVLYVAGLGRSGSTLLARLLGEVAGVASVGEVHHLWKTGGPEGAAEELCGCGRSYSECGFWPQVTTAVFDAEQISLEDVRSLQDRVSRVRRIRRLEKGGPPDFESAVEAYGSVWRSLYGEVLRRRGARWILDASKDLGPLYFLKRAPGLDLKILHLVRDPRGVAFSWGRRKRRPEFLEREVYMNRHRPTAAAWKWRYSNTLAERARRDGTPYLRVRYEDLIEQPAGTLRRICDWADLDEADLSFIDGTTARLDRAHCMVSGNPMRFDDGALTLRPDVRWRSEMRPIDRTVVSALTWPMRKRYGY